MTRQPDRPAFLRPDGRTYRPRKPGLRAHGWENQNGADGRHGVIVFGTLDPDKATPLAAEAIMYWHDGECVPATPEPGWYRDGYHWGERTWITDEKRGAPGVMFTCEGS